MDFTHFKDQQSNNLYARCSRLNILQMLNENVPWKTKDGMNKSMTKEDGHFRNIGRTGSFEFWNDFGLCRCIFALAPNPSSSLQDVILFTDWTMARIAGENGITISSDQKPGYAKCLLVALKPSSGNIEFSIVAHRGDALCIIDEDQTSEDSALRARIVDSTIIDFEVIKQWISTSHRLHHADCNPVHTDDLGEIRRIDLATLSIVTYPDSSCEYFALSYIWGGVFLPSLRTGSKLGALPQTIADVLILVEKMGKRYAWVDSLCIDQADELDKRNQIERM